MSAPDFTRLEEKISAYWKEHDVFAKSQELRSGRRRKNFVFFEGPPTANGLPHIGHFLTRVFKDLYGRYKTMRRYFVLRKAGWDTHGLPVELEVEKELGFKNKKDIEAYLPAGRQASIAKFNRMARESVWKYKKEWEDMTRRMGFWIDLEHPYVTYETPYIESLWAIIKKIWDKKLLYQAHRVVPFCVRCGTPLSSHEVAQGYKLVKDTSVYLKFKVKSKKLKSGQQVKPNTYILAWTTTPWTLPGNVALAVGNDISYVLVRSTIAQDGERNRTMKQDGDYLIVAKDVAESILGTPLGIESELKGADLVGVAYEPLFEIPQLVSKKSYHVYSADFVSTTEGTGVVHTAVMYGEDDYTLGTAAGLPKVHTVDEQGKFIGVSKELDGKYAKDPSTEQLILKILTEQGNVLKTQEYEHDYPFCWRCDSPLLYYAKDSWFIKVSALKDKLLKNNGEINWVPAHIKEGRFGQWLAEGKDWAFSRERYWGTPLPVWKCAKCEAYQAVGSVEELKDQTVGSGNTYYVLRHGYSSRDEREKLIVSSRLASDTYRLTDEGCQQIQDIIGKFKGLGGTVDAIYASPFSRTVQSAEIAGKLLHQGVITDERLGEIRQNSACEDKEYATCQAKIIRSSADKKEEDGESWNDVRSRLTDFMAEIDSKHRGKTILIVSHGDPLWLLGKAASGANGEQLVSDRSNGNDWYPAIGELKKMDWQAIPRNETGELDLHRPFIDEIVLKCGKCGSSMKKVPDLIDAWFDSGAMPYAQWHWPFENEKLFKEQFPADFIVEAVDQTRGWFYTLLVVSTLLGKGAPYKNVISLGLVLDEKGQKLSKSKKNYKSTFELMDACGVDALRWFFYTMNAPGDVKLFSERGVQERFHGFITTLQNCVRFYELYEVSDRRQAARDKQEKRSMKELTMLDKWVISRLNRLIADVTERLDAYDPTFAARAVESFVVEDLSQWWLRRSRKRPEAVGLLRSILFELSKLLAPFVPFTAEDIYLRVRPAKEEKGISIHLCDWPKADPKLVDEKLEEAMRQVRDAITAGLALRKEKGVRVRQPLHSVDVPRSEPFASDLEELIKDELNVKEVHYVSAASGVALDLNMTPALRSEGYAREMVRAVQDMRKEAGYSFQARAYCQWHSEDPELSAALSGWAETIKKETMLSDFVKQQHDEKKYDVEKEFEIAPGTKIWVGIKK